MFRHIHDYKLATVSILRSCQYKALFCKKKSESQSPLWDKALVLQGGVEKGQHNPKGSS